MAEEIKGGENMPHNDFILRHIHTHHDPFVQDLFKELDDCLKMMEEGGEEVFVERMKISDAILPAIVTAFITAFFFYALLSH